MAKSTLLSGRTYKILEEFTKIVLTPQAIREFSLEKVEFKESMSFLLKTCNPHARFISFLGLWVFEILTFFRYLKPFSKLMPSKRNHFYRKWHKSRSYIRYLLIRPLITLIQTAYYSHPLVASSLGFDDVKPGQKVIPEKKKGILDSPKGSKEIEVEVCVIGSGAGGAVVAKELAELGHEVLILEEGGVFTQEHFQKLPTIARNRLIYRDGGLFTTIGIPMVLLPAGCGVGGTTLINSGTCFRTPDSVLQQWSKDFGLSSISSKVMNPYFERVEKILKVEPVPDKVLGVNDRVVKRGVEKIGLHGAPLVRNAPGCEGSGVCIFGCPTGSKLSMERSYLPLAFEAGANLYPNCYVKRLVTQYDRVYKIEAIIKDPETGKPRGRLNVYPKKVVVSCGTLYTPLLLKRSKIGLKSGMVGKNLTVHPTGKTIALFDEKIDGFHGVPQAYSISDYESEGLMFESVFFPPWLLAISIHRCQEEHLEIMKAYRNLSIFGFLLHDKCKGRIVGGPGGRPMIFYNLGKKERDLYVKGLKVLARVFFAAGAKKIYPTLRMVHAIHSLEEMEAIDTEKVRRRDIETAAFHPLGTCRMGSDPRESVLNDQMKVHDLENIWVADGSVFPTSLGVNPQVTIMAFATRCAEMIHTAK